MNAKAVIEIIPREQLSQADMAAIIALCSRAYDEDYAPSLQTFVDSVHVLARLEGQLVSHALWITRGLQVGEGPLLRTAYVEGVATEERQRGQGFATTVMERLAQAITGFEVGALCPAETSLYARLGWRFWQGPLFHRRNGALIPDPEERVMLLRLPQTPDLDFSLPLSVEWREGEIW